MLARNINHFFDTSQPTKWLWLASMFIFLTSCNNNDSNAINNSIPTDLALHASIQETIKHSKIPLTQECMKQLGLCWYKFYQSANSKNLPDVNLQSNTSTLNLHHVTSITMVIDEKIGQKIENISLTVRGLPDNSTHEQNRDFILTLINDVKLSGWERFYLPEDPRIPGSQAAKIDTPGKILGHLVSSHPRLDPNFPIDINHWLKSGPLYKWYFQHDGEYLGLSAWRRDSENTPSKTGTYLIRLEFQSEREFWLSGITENLQRENWIALLPKRLERYHDARLALEKKARNAGIEIDETYQDPIIHALKK